MERNKSHKLIQSQEHHTWNIQGFYEAQIAITKLQIQHKPLEDTEQDLEAAPIKFQFGDYTSKILEKQKWDTRFSALHYFLLSKKLWGLNKDVLVDLPFIDQNLKPDVTLEKPLRWFQNQNMKVQKESLETQLNQINLAIGGAIPKSFNRQKKVIETNILMANYVKDTMNQVRMKRDMVKIKKQDKTIIHEAEEPKMPQIPEIPEIPSQRKLFYIQKVEREDFEESNAVLVVDAIKMRPRLLCQKNQYGKISTPQYSFYEYSNSSDQSFMKNFYNNKKRVVKQNIKFNQNYDKDNKEQLDINKLQTEFRLSFLAASCRTKTPRRELIQIAKKFSAGFENMGSSEDQELSSKYQYIFKNLLRDIKIYYQDQLQRFNVDHKLNGLNLKKKEKDYIFPAQILLFVQKTMDMGLIHKIKNIFGNKQPLSEFLKNICFTLGSMIDAKTVILSFNKTDEKMSSGLSSMIKAIKQKINNELFEKADINSDDFFGLFKNKNVEFKKLKAIEVYRYFFRFSIEKLQLFSNDIIFLILLLQYLKNEKMQRVHTRTVLAKNAESYYRAVENLLNYSQIRKDLPDLISTIEIIGNDKYEFQKESEIGQINSSTTGGICLRKLQAHNLSTI